MSHTGRARCVLFALAIQLAPLMTFSAASAQELPRSPAYQLKLDLDLPIVLVAVGMTSSFFFLPEAQGVTCAPRCDRSHINVFDRGSAGNYDPSWTTVGDIATGATLAAPALVIVLYEGVANGLNDDLVVAESALVTSALQVSLSYAVARPRPRAYSDRAPEEERTDANAARSFFSGHTANGVATSVAALRTFQRLGKPAIGWTMFVVGLAGSSVIGVARIESGAHFPSDVLIGAAIGAGFGLALPALHASSLRLVPFGDTERQGLLLSGAFL
jgi:membrane-associated phospholipid phosphatase